MILRPKVPATYVPPAPSAATRMGRKIALCGSHSSSLIDAPWSDPSWEWWGHSSSRSWYARPMDRYFDLHPKACWTRGGKKGDAYPKWLAQNTVPIFMQDRHPEVPASIRYPKGQILMQFSDARGYFTNHVAWMIALALSEGVGTIGLFGINYSTQGEYERQRGSAEYWLGRAAGAGVRVMLPEQCSLLREPALLYGYESHDEQTGVLKDEYKPKVWDKTITPVRAGQAVERAEAPDKIKAEIAAEELDYPRPEWARGPIWGRSDGEGLHE